MQQVILVHIYVDGAFFDYCFRGNSVDTLIGLLTSFFVNSPRQVDTGTINTGYTFVTATVRPRLRDGGGQFPVGLCPGCPGPAVRRQGPGGHHRRHEGRDHYDDDIRVPQPALQSMQSCQPERSGDDSIEKIHSELVDDRYRL